jgi:LmbE family N-acetylglucosaminyl deacetylase
VTNILVIAPHPDDETLGVGGTLLKHVSLGDSIHWLIVTAMDAERFDAARVARREAEIATVAAAYGFNSVSNLGYPTARLDRVPNDELIAAIGSVVSQTKADTLYLPYPADAHSDHNAVFLAAMAATKWFRYPSVQRILAYETLSETNFGLSPDRVAFRPNVYVNVSRWLDRKIEVMRAYDGETAEHPFPRSDASIRALATLRGSESGCAAAEAFMLLKEIIE